MQHDGVYKLLYIHIYIYIVNYNLILQAYKIVQFQV